MTLTKGQYEAAIAVRAQVVSEITDEIHSFQDPIDLDADQSLIVAEAIADYLFRRGFIDLAAVESVASP